MILCVSMKYCPKAWGGRGVGGREGGGGWGGLWLGRKGYCSIIDVCEYKGIAASSSPKLSSLVREGGGEGGNAYNSMIWYRGTGISCF